MSYSRIEKTTLPSALSGFTAEFEMDQVGHTCYCHRTKFLFVLNIVILNGKLLDVYYLSFLKT